MNGLVLGLYGIYLVVIGVRGKTDDLQALLAQDLPKFIPWALSIVVLVVMSQTEATAKLVKPFIFLLILNFTLRNWTNLVNEVNKLQNIAGGN